VGILGLSLYTLGLAIGPLVAAPLSELYGRRIIYWTTLPILLAFTAGAGAAQNIQTLLICRFLAGTGGSAAMAVGGGTIADVWDLQKDGGPMALLFVMSAFLGPSLGPLTGAYIIAEYNDWRYSMWVVLMVGAPILLLALLMKETSKEQILKARRRSKGARLTSLNADRPTHSKTVKEQLTIAFTRPIHMMFTEPLVAYISIYTGFAFAMMFSFFGSFPYVFAHVYQFDQKSVGLAFIGILCGFLFAVIVFGVFDKTIYRKAVVRGGGHCAPEHRLYSAMLGSLLLPIGMNPNSDDCVGIPQDADRKRSFLVCVGS
jgi:MFS family permease